MAKRIHHKLRAWQKAIELVKDVYQVTREFPKEEAYGLVSQMRRAAVSIPANIAEGAARVGDSEFRRFLVISRGSLSELETHVVIARELGFTKETDCLDSRIDGVFSLLGGLIRNKNRNLNS